MPTMRSIHPRAVAPALATLTVLALLPAARALATSAQPAQSLKEAEVEKLGGLLKRYVEASGDAKDQSKVREDLTSELIKIGKRTSKDGDDHKAVQAALALTEDLEHAVAKSYSSKASRGGKVEGRKLEKEGVEIEYSLWLPAAYKANTGPYPLVLIAPEIKEGKSMTSAQLLQEFWTDAATREAAVLVSVTMPDDPDTWNQIFVDGENGQRVLGGLAYLMAVYAEVRKLPAIDADRVFVAGRGAGVASAMALGATFPHLFAGVIGQAGDAGEVSWQNFQNLPVFLQGGGAQATAFGEKVKEAGYDNATVVSDAEAAALLTWINEHPRVANPAKVTLVPGAPIPNSAYWLEVPPTMVEEGTYVKAEADRASNTIRVEGKGVRSVILYFNDVMVDLGQPLKLVLNGQERELVVQRSLDDFLSFCERGTNDGGRVFVARRAFDLPE
jgi:poly(3-hydroxybutyrate) depolymerase